MAQQIDTINSINGDQSVFAPGYSYKNIMRTFIVISTISSVVFLALSYLTSEFGYYLLAGSALITLVLSIASLPRPPKKPSAFIVFLLSLSYQLLIILLASILPSYLGIPYALISILLAFIFTSVIPRSAVSDWIVTVGILGAIASLELTILALLPQVN
ncbi:MAG TPA: hypothetical protein PK883_09630, partial [Anaerolineaceae bacterium]|nr:hypothetical protein [Anaerolineaceae bacterium]